MSDSTQAPSTPGERPTSERPTGERLAGERTDYAAAHLQDEVAADPLALFDVWMNEAFTRRETHGDLAEPTAVVLSTIADAGDGGLCPRSRTVLLKARDERGFVVYTNLESDKGREAAAHAVGSLLLPWYPLQRQVRIEGVIEQVGPAAADAYFATRPRGSQLGAWASRQSRPVKSRKVLEAQYAQAAARFDGEEVPRPPFWGGLRVVPDRIEFWQGRENRLHDRIVFTRAGADWERHRLQP